MVSSSVVFAFERPTFIHFGRFARDLADEATLDAGGGAASA
jgi:hypothetical protein